MTPSVLDKISAINSKIEDILYDIGYDMYDNDTDKVIVSLALQILATAISEEVDKTKVVIIE